MDVTAIAASVSYESVATAVLLIFAALAGLYVAVTGGRLLLDAISGDDDKDEQGESFDDETDDTERH